MSGFVKRKQTVNTVNPAGGIRPSLEPNVGQYGWTKSDSAHVNQLIAYVNAAKEYAEQAKQGADFITGKIDDITDLYNKVIFMYDKVIPLATRIEFIYRNILTIQDDIDGKFEEIEKWHADINAWVVEVRTLHREAGEFSATAIKAATDAAESAQQASDIAEELRKGMVYRGTWNVEATSAYPPHGDTNSTWDVILNPGSLEFTWSGTTWYWGDRLIYLKDDNKYQQVESGTTVVSVNGKKGAVILNAADIGAAAVVDKKIVVPGFGTGKGATIKNVLGGDGYETVITTRPDSDLPHHAIGVNENQGAVYWDGGAKRRIYHTNNKPTPADIGAAQVVANKIVIPSGYSGGLGAEIKNQNIDTAIGSETWITTRSDSDPEHRAIGVGEKLGPVYWDGLRNRLYHEGYKPTASDVGAISKENGSFSGTITSETNTVAHAIIKSKRGGFEEVLGVNERVGAGGAFVGKLDYWIRTGNETEQPKVQRGKDVYELYHQGNKPTPADVGAIPINRTNGTPVAAYFADTEISPVGTKISLPYTTSSGKMVSFTIRVYQGYNTADIQVSGYLYSATDNWYLPKAIMIAGSVNIRVKMGRGDDGKAYVHLTGADYRGIGIFDVVSGYTEADWNSGWVITKSDDTPNVTLDTITYPPYSPNNKPTAADLGTVSKDGDTLRGGSTIQDYGPGYLNLMGKSHGFFGGVVASYLTCNAYFDGAWKKTDNSKSSTHIEVVGGQLNLYMSAAGSTNPAELKYQIYHSGNKPTASEVGALANTGGALSGPLRIQPVNSAPMFSLDGNLTGNYSEIAAGVGGAGDFKWGTSLRYYHNGDFWSIGTHKVYHEGFKPTTLDIEYTNPRTKNVETLMDIISNLTSRIEALEKQIKENT